MNTSTTNPPVTAKPAIDTLMAREGLTLHVSCSLPGQPGKFVAVLYRPDGTQYEAPVRGPLGSGTVPCWEAGDSVAGALLHLAFTVQQLDPSWG